MGKKVLVVDDERLIVKGIKFSLVQDDMEVDCAYDGEEALEMAKRQNMISFFLMSCCQRWMDLKFVREYANFPICPSLC